MIWAAEVLALHQHSTAVTKQQKQTNKVQSMCVAVVVGGGGGVGIFNDIWSRLRSSAEETALFFLSYEH